MVSIHVSNQENKELLLGRIYSILLKRALKRKLRKQVGTVLTTGRSTTVASKTSDSTPNAHNIDLESEDMRKCPGEDIISTGGSSECQSGSQPVKPSNYPATTPSISAG